MMRACSVRAGFFILTRNLLGFFGSYIKKPTMKQSLLSLRQGAVILLALFCQSVFAQLPSFTVSAASTPQTCLGNGTISFTVSGTQPGAVMAYEVYLLPNTTVPVATVTDAVATNLIAGSYQIVAIQSLGGLANTATTTATIADYTVPLVYNLTTGTTGCGQNGSIEVNVTSGTAVSYEITSGPVTVPQQESGIFTGLPSGQYMVKVYDDCGNGVVVTAQVVSSASSQIEILPGEVKGVMSCDTVLVGNYYYNMNNGIILWPLTFEYTVYPPGGGEPVIVTATVDDQGTAEYLEYYQEIPFYYGQLYSYVLKITDACGNVFISDPTMINVVHDWDLGIGHDPCQADKVVIADTEFIQWPITVDFLSAPAGFNPVQYNASHPVFASGNVTYFQQGATIPEGIYEVKITDACGHSSIKSVSATPNTAFRLESIPGECGFGGIRICMGGKACVVKGFTNGPAEFSNVYPVDIIGELQQNNDIDLTRLTTGTYTIHIIDECGYEYTDTFAIYTMQPPANITLLPGCQENFGSVKITRPGEMLTGVIITAAPASFGYPLPYDASANISWQNFFMNTLPPGDYVFSVTTEECENPAVYPVTIFGLEITQDEVEAVYNCGSYNIRLAQQNNNLTAGYWLQQYNETAMAWGHPYTGVADPSFMFINSYNAFELSNNAINYNLSATGQIRVVRVMEYYGNGTGSQHCINVLHEFNFDGGPQIINAFAFPCDDGTSNIIIQAEGVPPLSYAVTHKNGQPFAVENGTSSLFTGLVPAVYNFRISDICGNVRTIMFDTNTLAPMEIDPDGFCSGSTGRLVVPNFPFLVYEWYKDGAPDTVLSTTNQLLFTVYDPTVDTGIYKVHIKSIAPGACIDIVLSREIIPAIVPNAGEDNMISMCETETIDLEAYLSANHDPGGVWRDISGTGMLAGNMLDAETLPLGSYDFTYTVFNECGEEDAATITLEIVEPGFAPIPSGICRDGKYILSVENAADMPNATFTWAGPVGFTSSEPEPDISGLHAGIYLVVVASNGCKASATLRVEDTRCGIPKGISPNNDGLNDSFDLSNLEVSQLQIFNRYGVTVYEQENYTKQWYGQSDKGELPAGTYYYVVTLPEAKRITGWVYLQRE